MDIASDEELACVKLVESYIHLAIGGFDIDPKPELKQPGAQYHIWQSGDLIGFFKVNGTATTITPWSPYRYRHFACFGLNDEQSRNLQIGNPATFSLADPDNSKIVNFIASLRCNCERSRNKEY